MADEEAAPVEEAGPAAEDAPAAEAAPVEQAAPVEEVAPAMELPEQPPSETPSKSTLKQPAPSASALEMQPSRVQIQEPMVDSATKLLDEALRVSRTRRESELLMEPGRRASRSSKTRAAMGSIISIRRSSVAGDIHDRGRTARYANTYKLESDKPFHVETVEGILENIMLEVIENMTYDPEKCAKQAKMASAAIRSKVKEHEFDRYRIVAIVTIGEKASQDVYIGCRFLWDAQRDRYAKFVCDNMQVFAIALCFGLYYE